jgi:hypothetical protein
MPCITSGWLNREASSSDGQDDDPICVTVSVSAPDCFENECLEPLGCCESEIPKDPYAAGPGLERQRILEVA